MPQQPVKTSFYLFLNVFPIFLLAENNRVQSYYQGALSYYQSYISMHKSCTFGAHNGSNFPLPIAPPNLHKVGELNLPGAT
jgi:hypothetical protein